MSTGPELQSISVDVGVSSYWIITIASHVSILPLLSVTVKVTELLPIWFALNSVWLTLKVISPQSSKLPLLMSSAVIVAIPWFKLRAMSLHIAVGAVGSVTVTICVAAAVLPLESITVHVTVVSPIL